MTTADSPTAFPARPCSFEDVLLDWAIAEVLSPDAWWTYYRMLGPEFRSRIADAADNQIGPSDRALLLEVVAFVRKPLISDLCGLSGEWEFNRCYVPAQDLGAFAIIPQFADRYGVASLAALVDRLAQDPSPEDENIRSSIESMRALRRTGGRFRGLPVATWSPQAPTPLLVEGYKRTIVALLEEASGMDIFLCSSNHAVPGRRMGQG